MHVDGAGDSGAHLSPPDTGDRNGKGHTGAEALGCEARPPYLPFPFPSQIWKWFWFWRLKTDTSTPTAQVHTDEPLKFVHSQCKTSFQFSDIPLHLNNSRLQGHGGGSACGGRPVHHTATGALLSQSVSTTSTASGDTMTPGNQI